KRARLRHRAFGESRGDRKAPIPRSRRSRRSALSHRKSAASYNLLLCDHRNPPAGTALMPLDEPSEAIRAMLRHTSDTEPGITRKRMGRYWAYFDTDGNRISDRDEIDRLNGIGLPPAYTDAWFCDDPDGHLQATGVDARGRKQYRYHQQFREKRESAKFE